LDAITRYTFDQFMHSLGIKPMTLMLLAGASTFELLEGKMYYLLLFSIQSIVLGCVSNKIASESIKKLLKSQML